MAPLPFVFAIAWACGPSTFTISGTISGDVSAEVDVYVSNPSWDPGSRRTRTDASGRYSFAGIEAGTYRVSPGMAGYAFSPSARTVALRSADSSGNDFIAYTLPAAPANVRAVLGNGQVTVSFETVAGATSYDVYAWHSPSRSDYPVPRTSATASPVTVTGLGNDQPRFFGVSASNAHGEGPESVLVCAVPTASSTAGLTLYDGLCGERLDGRRWWSPGAYSMSPGWLSVDVADQEPRSSRNADYGPSAEVNAGASRVTTLSADIAVPITVYGARTGASQLRSAVRLAYQPPASRLNYPGNAGDLLFIEVGLLETPRGLEAYRMVGHLDDPLGTAVSQAGVRFDDPPGFEAPGSGLASARASDGVRYTATASYDEVSGVFGWKIAGGSFGAGVAGTADPSTYLAATPAWSGIPLAGAGFSTADLIARTNDPSPTGGGSGRVAPVFYDTRVGLDGGTPAPWDDFSGVDGNSDFELSLAKWRNGGRNKVALEDGRLKILQFATGAGSAASLAHGVFLSDPASVDTLQADVAVGFFSTSGPAPASPQVVLGGRFYNDGTLAGRLASAAGDVQAGVILDPVADVASWRIDRCASALCDTLTNLLSGTFTGVSVGWVKHAMRTTWDPGTHSFTFSVDGISATVDPTPSAPFAGPAHAPFRSVTTRIDVPPVAGSAAYIEALVNNVFTAP